MVRAPRQLYVFEEPSRACASVAPPGDLQRREDILQRRHRGDEVERLEDKAELASSERGERVFAHACDLLAVDDNPPGGRRVEPGHKAEQSGLAAARGADDRDELPVGNRQVKLAENGQALRAGLNRLGDLV